MRLDEWQRHLDAEFVEASAAKELIGDPAAPADGQDGAAQGTPAPAEAPVAPPAALPEGTAAAEGQAGIIRTDRTAEPGEKAPSADAFAAPETETNDAALDPDPDFNAASPTRRRASDLEPAGDTAIAPFAEYIGVRAADDAGPEEVAAAETEAIDTVSTPAEEWMAAEPAATAGPARGAAGYPLTASATTLAALGLGDSPAIPQDPAEALRKDEMLARLCDPLLSRDEAAVLLGVPASAVSRLADEGALSSYVLPDPMARTELQLDLEPGVAFFQLSDVVAYMAANGTPPRA